MGILQIFLDETYPSRRSAELLAIASVGAFEAQWKSYVEDLERISGVSASRKPQAIREFVAARHLHAVIGGVRLDEVGGFSGVRDQIDPVTIIARRDNVWSQVMGYCISQLLKRVLEEGWVVHSVEPYYDARDLVLSHREQVARSLRSVSERASARYIGGRDVEVKDPVSVPKRSSVVKSSPVQWGTWLAHWVARLPRRYAGPTMPANVEVYDFTPIVRRFLRLSGTLGE